MSTQPNRIPQATTPAPAVMPNQGRSWLGRNWKKLLAAMFLCGAIFVVGIFTLIMGAMRSSDVAKEAIARAQSSQLLAERLGAPISEGWLVGGSINVSPGAGDADLSLPISGPKGKGTVYVRAQKTAGTWAYLMMVATTEGNNDRIDLLASASAPEPQASTPSSASQPGAEAPNQPAPSQPATTDTSVAMAAAPEAPAADPAPAAAPPQAKPGSVIASAQYSNDPSLRCDVLEVKRVSGGALLARWRFVNTGAKPVSYDFSWDDIYYIDPEGNKKYNFLTIDGKRILDQWWGTLQPGEQRVVWAKYPAPPATSKRISLNVPKFTPFEDIPVSE
jgi:hypothetical protein